MASSPLPPGAASIMVLARMNARQVAAAEAMVDRGVPLCDFDPLETTLGDADVGAALAGNGAGSGEHAAVVGSDGSVEKDKESGEGGEEGRQGSEGAAADGGSFDAFPLRDSELGSARNTSVLFPPLLASAAPNGAATAFGGDHDASQLEVVFSEGNGGGSFRRYVASAARGKRCSGSACTLQRAVAFHYRPQCAYLWHQLDRLARGEEEEEEGEEGNGAESAVGAAASGGEGITTVRSWAGQDAVELPAPYGTAGEGGVNVTAVVARDLDPTRPQASMMAEAHLRFMSMSMRMLASRDTTMAVRAPAGLFCSLRSRPPHTHTPLALCAL